MDQLFLELVSASSLGAYAAIFGILIICGLGVPLPEDVPLMAAGYLTWRGTMNAELAFATTMIGVLLGDTMLFFIGRRIGPAIMGTPWIEAIVSKKRQRRVKAYFRVYGDRVVFLARFVAGIRGAVFFLAGATNVRYRRFLMFDALAALLSVPVWLLLGYGLGHWLGDEVEKVLDLMNQFRTVATVVAVAIAIVLIGTPVFRIIRAGRRAQKAADRSA